MPDGIENIEVPAVACPLQPEELQQLMMEVDPLRACDDHGVGLYIEARVFVRALLQ